MWARGNLGVLRVHHQELLQRAHPVSVLNSLRAHRSEAVKWGPQQPLFAGVAGSMFH